MNPAPHSHPDTGAFPAADRATIKLVVGWAPQAYRHLLTTATEAVR